MSKVGTLTVMGKDMRKMFLPHAVESTHFSKISDVECIFNILMQGMFPHGFIDESLRFWG